MSLQVDDISHCWRLSLNPRWWLTVVNIKRILSTDTISGFRSFAPIDYCNEVERFFFNIFHIICSFIFLLKKWVLWGRKYYFDTYLAIRVDVLLLFIPVRGNWWTWNLCIPFPQRKDLWNLLLSNTFANKYKSCTESKRVTFGTLWKKAPRKIAVLLPLNYDVSLLRLNEEKLGRCPSDNNRNKVSVQSSSGKM